ncbi:retrotransposon protein [Apostichopus japonicus]|uniref:Retrotransposon protein n=1 Tax=Stichopus japonicus TaxID=307972 RepID=A0A2G8LNI1_STIJA|nr:retrotransposon protein [Apostichopus japonicus]
MSWTDLHGLKAKPKVPPVAEGSTLLGHVVSAEGISTVPEKCAVIKDWPTPTSVSDTRCFLGMAGFYRRFIKDFSKIAGPLYELTSKPKNGLPPKKAFEWSPRCQDALTT